MKLALGVLAGAVEHDAAIRRRRRLQPAGGTGDKIFPPTYPDDRKPKLPSGQAPPGHVIEKRRINGTDVDCVLVDSVQSQANRLEEALLAGLRNGHYTFPFIEVDFSAISDLSDIGTITSLEAPHRVFDAILRDSQMGKTSFGTTEQGQRLIKASMRDATAVLELSPTALVFGAWNSTGQGGGLGAKFPRCITSEIIGVGAELGRRTSSRIDPLGIQRNIEVFKGEDNWSTMQSPATPKRVRPSEINHGNIRPSITDGLGATIDYAEHTAVLSLAGLRKLSFPANGSASPERDNAGRVMLAAIAIAAITEQDRAGYALRSRCDLVVDAAVDAASDPGFKLVHADGSVDSLVVDAQLAQEVLSAAIASAKDAGFSLGGALRLVPSENLAEIVRKSRELALRGEAQDDAAAPGGVAAPGGA